MPATEGSRHYLEVLHSIGREAARGGTAHERLGHLVAHVARELRWDVCSIYVCDSEADNELVLTATYGLKAGSVGRVRLPLSEGLVGYAAREEESVFLKEAAQDPRFRYFPETGEGDYVSMAAVPMMRHGKVLGVLTIQTRTAHEFMTADRHFLELLAAQIAAVVDIALSLRTIHSRTVFYGTPVAKGISLARVHRFITSPEKIAVAARGFRGVNFEKDLFLRSLKLALNQLERLISQMKEVSPPAAQIFVANRMILEDPDLSRRVIHNIESRQESAPRAVAFVMDAYIEKFSAISDPLLQEKSQDIKDLRDMLLTLMMDEKITHFAPEFEEENMIVVATELTPQEVLRLDTSKVVGLVTEKGSELSHVAVLARALKLPTVLGVLGIVEELKPEDRVLVDGNSGYVFINPDADIQKSYFDRCEDAEKRHRSIETFLANESEPAQELGVLDANIGIPFEIDEAVEAGMKAVGLFRTEFFYMQQPSWPSDEIQAAFYHRLLKAFDGNRHGDVTIRLLDIGGDKYLPYMPNLKEDNPHLGFRSIRLLLDHPEILRSQLSAIHAASEQTGVTPRILVPMVTHAWELAAVRETMLDVAQQKNYPLGIMIEVPGTLFQIEELSADADFISVGTNDLAQYLLAVDRNNSRVTHLCPPLHPALLRALRHLFLSLSKVAKPFSVCGEMAGDPLTALALLIIGYRRLTVSPSRISEMRYLLRRMPPDLLTSLREPLLRIDDHTVAEKILRLALREHAPLLT